MSRADVCADTYDMPTQHNSPIYKDHRANLDAGPVGICRAAGALIFGKTVSRTALLSVACLTVGSDPI